MGALTSTAWLGCLRSHQSCIEIRVHKNSLLNVYTSGSSISGSAIIAPQSDLDFDALEISFVGTTATRVDSLQRWPSPTPITFLQHKSVVAPTSLPEDCVFKAGQTYNIPFNFVVPSQLPPSACRHQCDEAVREQHLRLPPTLGHWNKDDQAPDTARIEYEVKAVINLKDLKKAVEARKTIKVLPLVPEDAPILPNPKLKRYRLSNTKKIKPSVISSSIGCLSVTASQPNPIILSVDTLETLSSSIKLHLEFAPTNAPTAPPDVQSVTATINSATHVSIAPTAFLPDLELAVERQLCAVVSSSTNLKADLEHPEHVVWQQQTPSRTGSGKECRDQSIKHVTTLAIPFFIPNHNNMLLLPTFHSCYISRTYTIHFKLTMGPYGTTLSLAIPLQVTTVKGTDASADELPDYAQVFPGEYGTVPYHSGVYSHVLEY